MFRKIVVSSIFVLWIVFLFSCFPGPVWFIISGFAFIGVITGILNSLWDSINRLSVKKTTAIATITIIVFIIACFWKDGDNLKLDSEIWLVHLVKAHGEMNLKNATSILEEDTDKDMLKDHFEKSSIKMISNRFFANSDADSLEVCRYITLPAKKGQTDLTDRQMLEACRENLKTLVDECDTELPDKKVSILEQVIKCGDIALSSYDTVNPILQHRYK